MSPAKERDAVEEVERPRERRHRSSRTDKKDRDRDRDGDGERAHRHHKSSRSSKSKAVADESRPHRRHRTREEKERGRDDMTSSIMTDLVPELARGMGGVERVSVPYPSFSKAHSKEKVHSREDVSVPSGRRTDPLTPEPTDLGSDDANLKRSKSADASCKASSPPKQETRTADRPPSPPETDLSAEKKRSSTSLPRPSGSSNLSKSTTQNDVKSKLSKTSSQATFVLLQHAKPSGTGSETRGTSRYASPSASTSVPPRRTASAQTARPSVDVDDSPDSAPDSSPETPTQPTQFVGLSNRKHQAYFESELDVPVPSPPAPPPPPALNIQEAPRVDYLLQNGGLAHSIPKSLLSALPRQTGYRPCIPPLQGAEPLFAPFFNLLDQYQTVLSGHGSIAVATGHRSVARRLLHRLENVFSRDLSPDGCSCIVCERSGEPHRGLGWGEVLERVSGRIDLPPWPPFDLASLGVKAVENMAGLPARPASPVKVDPDIADEFREHYLRQTKKVRAAVDKWMAHCDKAPAPEIDDETLNFAILTNIDQEDRPYFNALLSGSRDVQPATRAPTPARKCRNDFLVKTGLSLQRLYRLNVAPRDAESAVYLVRNRGLHDLLYTISDINPSEWEMLTSGRFDGFLWSGADDDGGDGGGSRRPTPANAMFSPGGGRYTPGSRNTTPASFISGLSSTTGSYFPSGAYKARTAVSLDEETELAVLAEVERNIFAGMEALEDAFETLHSRAEAVRTALRERGAALSMSLRSRRGVDVLLPGPDHRSAGAGGGLGPGDDESVVSDSDWGGDDASEIAPDDSASNISTARLRRPKRRKERATPAPIEEEEEKD